MAGAVERGRTATSPAARHLKLPVGFVKNVSLNGASVMVSALSALVVTPVLLHHLGVDAYGVWALATSVIGYLELLELGFGSASTRLMDEDARKRSNGVSATLSSALAVLAVLGAVAAAVSAAVAFGAPHWFHTPRGLATTTTGVFLALGVALSLSIPGDAFGGALAAYQRYDLRSLSNILLVATTTISTVLIVEAGGTLVAVAVAFAALSVAMHPLRWLMLHRVDRDLSVTPRLVTWARVRTVARVSGWFILGELTAAASFSIDLLIIGVALDLKEVGLYAIGSKLANFAQRALDEVAAVLLPEAASLSADGARDAVGHLLIDGTRVTMLVGTPAALVTGVLASAAVRAWVGTGYDRAATVLVILSAYGAVRTVVTPMEFVILGAGDVRRWSLAMTAQAALNVGATLALVAVVGLPGPALGTLIATVVVMVPAFMALACSATGIAPSRFVRGAVVPHLIPSAVTGAVLVILRHTAQQSRAELIGVGAGALALYAVLYYIFGAAPAEREHVRRLIGRPGPIGRHYRRR